MNIFDIGIGNYIKGIKNFILIIQFIQLMLIIYLKEFLCISNEL